MRIRFNQNHLLGLQRDTVLSLNARYAKSGETEFIIDDTDFSGAQLLALAKEGVQLDEGMRTFIHAPAGFLDTEYDQVPQPDGTTLIRTMRDYLAQHMAVTLADGSVLVLLQAEGAHFTSEQLVQFAQYGEILNIEEYQMYAENGGRVLSIAQIAGGWTKYFTDYKQARKAMQEQVLAIGWENLPEADKRTVALWFATTAANINTVLTVEEQLAAGYLFDANSMESRKKRYKTVFNDFRGLLTGPDAMKVQQRVKQNGLQDLYVEAGYEGQGAVNYRGEVDLPSILDFLHSTPGTPFETTGLDSLGLVPLHGKTVAELKERATNIIKYGNY